MQSVLKVVVYDSQGVMDRILGHVRRLGCNISSIAAGEVEDGVHDIFIAFQTEGVDIEYLGKRLSDLDFVISWAECTRENSYMREMIVGRVDAGDWDNMGVQGARILDRQGNDIFFEYTDTPENVDSILHRLRKLNFNCTRTGPVCLSKEVKEV